MRQEEGGSGKPMAPGGHRDVDSVVTKVAGNPRPWPYLSLGTMLALAFGSLVALSVGTILAISVRANLVNTISLLDVRAVSLIENMERQMGAEAGQAKRTVSAIARLYADGVVDTADTPGHDAAFQAFLEAAPAVQGVVIETASGRTSLFRTDDGGFSVLPPRGNEQELEAAISRESWTVGPAVAWGPPSPIGEGLFHKAGVALERGDGGRGIAVAFVSQQVVSEVMRRVAPAADATVFLLTQNGGVVSHSGRPELFSGPGIMNIKDFPDTVLRQLPGSSENDDFPRASSAGIRVNTAERHVFLTKTLAGFSAQPLVLGIYLPAAEIGGELLRTLYSLIAGLAGLAISVIAAILLGSRISRPMAQVAATANRISDFRLEEIEPLPPSRIVEIDNQIKALNRMRAALLQFSRYVPRHLVARLMRTGVHANIPEEREATILFTDIIGFTGLSERMSASQTAELLNRHFEMIAGKVDATGGTIDKYMGDSVMAFWGAPEEDPDHTLHAVRSAQAIGQAVRADNAQRRASGELPLRVRIGIHTGKVVVGDIGSADRQNYTVIGDVVNVAHRLEQLAKEVHTPADDVVTLVSAQVAEQTRAQMQYQPLGRKRIRGRKGMISVHTLV